MIRTKKRIGLKTGKKAKKTPKIAVEENEIVGKFFRARGDPKAREEVYEYCWPKISIAVERRFPKNHFLHDEAVSACHQKLIELMNSPQRLRRDTNPSNYLITIFNNAAVDLFRKYRKEKKKKTPLDELNNSDLFKLAELIEKPDRIMDTRKFERILALCEDSLGGRERQVFFLRYEGLSDKEIAKRLGVHESTVRSHLYFARERIKDAIKKRKLL